ncbi:hypothetical protein KJ682_08140 [bacterium]|nr:hypothetical protein [bacterium]
MLKEIHNHMVNELQQISRTDTVFVVSAVVFNLVALGINWGVASESGRGHNPGQNDMILALLILGTILINAFAIRALLAGRATRSRLVTGLRKMYQDNGVDQYYDEHLLKSYQARYSLFSLILGVIGLLAIVVPLIARSMAQA